MGKVGWEKVEGRVKEGVEGVDGRRMGAKGVVSDEVYKKSDRN